LPAGENVFVGKSHRAAVSTLVERFHGLTQAGPALVCLTAPPGWGKTRVVQEFYVTLAKAQPEPPYWPPQLERGDGPEMRAILEGRKSVYPPEVVVPPDAVLPWFWWAILCQRRPDGTFSQAIFDDATQLYAHADSILGRIGAGGTLGRAFDASGSVIDLISLLGVTLFPPVGLALGVAGAARTGWQNRDLVEKVRRAQRRRQERQVDAGSYGRGEQIEEIATQLVTLSRAVPIILVVDDAHYADDTLVEAIGMVLRNPSAQILIVATAWPQELDDEDEEAPFPAWWNSELDEETQERLTRIDLEMLDRESATQLVLADFSDGDPSLAGRIIDRWGTNPLLLRMLVRLPRVRAALISGDLGNGGLSRLPQQAEAILGEYWGNLPADVQGTLALASRLGSDFVPSVVVDAAPRVGSGPDAVREAIDPYAWVREYDPTLHGFVERGLWEIACRGAEELLDPGAIDGLSAALEEAVLALDGNREEMPERTVVTLWRQHTAFVEDGMLPPGELAARSALGLAAHLAARLQYEDAVRLGETALGWSSFPALEVATIRRSIGGWLRQAGRFPEARGQLQRAVQVMEDSGDRLEAARARRDLGDTYRYLGDLEAAVECFQVALSTFEAEGDLRAAASALNGIGDAYRGLSKWDLSLDRFRKCLDIYRQLGDERELARALVRYGMVARDRWQNAAALEAYSEALPVFRDCGDRRWEARTIRHIGVVDRNEGRLDEARLRFDECERIFTELNDVRGRAVTLRNRGDTFRLMSDFKSAERDLESALAIFRRIDDRRWEARTKLSLADMHRRQRRRSLAQPLISSARDFYVAIGDKPAEGRALRAEGLLLRDSGEADAALVAFEKSQAIFESLGDDLWVARTLIGQASVLGEGDAERRSSLREQAHRICAELGVADEQTRERWLAEW
jgi:tetratricopeptide (TPR) repeat protein